MKICYFGIYNPDFGRNKIYISGLRELGHEVVECRDTSPGLVKWWHLWQKHRAIKNSYDFMIVGYPGHLLTPLAKLISRKKVAVDALGSLYDAEINSHQPSFVRKLKSRLVDWLMVKFADVIFLESAVQKIYFEQKFGASAKYQVLYTGADQKFVASGLRPSKINTDFLVLFRGKLTPESGIMIVLAAAKMLLTEKNIKFKIIGSGYLLQLAEAFVEQESLDNVELISRFLPDQELAAAVSQADLMLGQFADNPRLNRTIPHKAFEALASGVPYLTGAAIGVKEVVSEGQTGFMVPLADPVALASKIKVLAQEPAKLAAVGETARQLFVTRFTPKALALEIIKIML